MSLSEKNDKMQGRKQTLFRKKRKEKGMRKRAQL